MFKKLFHVRMRERRCERSLLQTQAAHLCDMTPQRWSDLERGYRLPSQTEFELVSSLLGLRQVFVPPRSANKLLLNRASCQVPTPQPFFPHQDRLTHIRFRACARQYPGLVDGLLRRVARRADFRLCEYLCHRISCDSNLEPLHLLYLLSLWAEPGLYTPALCGHTRWPIVDCKGTKEVGFRPRPCMRLDDTFYFFQVSFRASSVMRVDTLCWDGAWYILEIDGRGHDFTGDATRARELELPMRTLNTDELRTKIEAYLWKKAS
jgi:DNA-binding XRE family transcriptional regulator